jgi:hypothetical protein
MNLSILGFFLSLTAYAAPPLDCKDLDFSSYHKVENAKGNLIRSNPERKHANFAGKYLLLKNDYLFDTVWFIADCTTGKFIKETLSTDHKDPVGEFNSESNQLILRSSYSESKIPTEYHVFQNEKWMQVDPTASPTPSPTPSPTLANVNSVKNDAPTCKELDFNSNSRSQSAKKNLQENTPDRTHPNFAGHYLLLKGDTIFETYWLIADCNSGKFYSDLITGNIEFDKNSNKIKQFISGKFPTYSYWLEDGSQWFNERGKNVIYGKNAKALFESLPNKEKSSILRFEKLNWKLENIEIKIKTGKCSSENKKYTCDLEIE